MKERIFIQKAKEQNDMKEFIRKQFNTAKCSTIEVYHTPVVTRIIIHTTSPGLVIGRGGERLRETIENIKNRFNVENPQIDIKKITNPSLDPVIVSQDIASALERGLHFKRLGNFYISKIMNAGAIGCEIVLSGKIRGQRGRIERFSAGFLKKCGDPARKDVIQGFTVANPKLGNIGVTVKIMINQSKDIIKKQEETELPKQEEIANSEEADKENHKEPYQTLPNSKEKSETKVKPDKLPAEREREKEEKEKNDGQGNAKEQQEMKENRIVEHSNITIINEKKSRCDSEKNKNPINITKEQKKKSLNGSKETTENLQITGHLIKSKKSKESSVTE